MDRGWVSSKAKPRENLLGIAIGDDLAALGEAVHWRSRLAQQPNQVLQFPRDAYHYLLPIFSGVIGEAASSNRDAFASRLSPRSGRYKTHR